MKLAHRADLIGQMRLNRGDKDRKRLVAAFFGYLVEEG